MSLIYEQNSGITQGEQQIPVNGEEIVSNLTRSLGITLTWGNERRTYLDAIMVGGLGTVGGIVFLIGSFFLVEYLFEHSSPFSDFVFVLLHVMSGVALILGLGYPNLVRAFMAQSHLSYANQIFHKLVASGEIIEGEMLTIISVGFGKTQIEYQFLLPNGSETLSGVYITTINKEFCPGDTVYIFFLNPNIHVLL